MYSSPSYRPTPKSPPKIPVRTSSLSPKKVTSKEDILFLVGRKPYSPPRTHARLQESNSSNSLGVNDFMERILDNSSSEDTQSMLSSLSGITLDSVKGKSLSIGRPGSAPLHKGLAKTASDASSIKSTESDSVIEKTGFRRTRSPGGGLAFTTSLDSCDSAVSRTVRAHRSLVHTRSLPTQNDIEDISETGLPEIREGEEMASPRSSQEREMSPTMLEPPLSPIRDARAVSPSRKKIRKGKFASKRGPPRLPNRNSSLCKYISQPEVWLYN